MQLIKNRGRTQYIGATYPTPLNMDKLNLKDTGLKIIHYVTTIERGQRPIFETIARNKFTKYYHRRGSLICLYAGKSGKITTLTREYKSQNLVGILFWNNIDIMDYYSCLHSSLDDRIFMKKVKQFMLEALNGKTKAGRDGILYYLNQKEWNYSIEKNGKTLLKKSGLKEHGASIEMQEKLNTLTK